MQLSILAKLPNLEKAIYRTVHNTDALYRKNSTHHPPPAHEQQNHLASGITQRAANAALWSFLFIYSFTTLLGLTRNYSPPFVSKYFFLIKQ